MSELKLDLATLKHVKRVFGIHSDMSSKCHGYYSLCRIIDAEEARQKKLAEHCPHFNKYSQEVLTWEVKPNEPSLITKSEPRLFCPDCQTYLEKDTEPL